MRRLVAVLLIVGLWLAGLYAFADRVIHSTPAAEPEDAADAIVVLTGASDMRIKEGMRLLERRKGARLLISGVNREVKREELLPVTEGSKKLYECCVDLGYEAQTTLGNAYEVAEWAKAKGFDDLIVVTSDYHMPRSLLEIKGTLPGVKLHAYPVATPTLDARAWWKSWRSSRVLVVEYTKYLAILARDLFTSVTSRFGHKEDQTAGASEASAEGSAS